MKKRTSSQFLFRSRICQEQENNIDKKEQNTGSKCVLKTILSFRYSKAGVENKKN